MVKLADTSALGAGGDNTSYGKIVGSIEGS